MPPSPSDPPPDVRQPPAPPVWATTLSAAPAPHDNAPAEPLLPSRLQPIVALIAAAGLAGMAIWFAAAGGFTGGLVAERDTPSHPSDSNPAGYRVDINTARRVELLQLPRIGPALADRIIERRTTVGPYAAIDDLLAVSGIGEITLAEIRPFLQPLPTATPPPAGPSTDDLRTGQ